MVRKRKDCHSNRNGSILRDKPVQRNAANARERARMRVLSKAFSRLKTTLPWVPPDTKLSKLDTLRLAASYIAHLRQILSTDDEQQGPNIHPLNLTWPFTFSAIKPHDSSGEANEDEIEDEEDDGEGEEEEEEEEEDEDDVEHMECNGDTGNAMTMMNGNNNTMLNNYSYYPII